MSKKSASAPHTRQQQKERTRELVYATAMAAALPVRASDGENRK